MARSVLPLLAVAATAVSCSLLVPLDYTGGTEPGRASRGGQSGTGGLATGGLPDEGLGGTLGEAGMSEAGQAGTPEGGMGNEGAVGGTVGGTEPGTGGTAAGTGGAGGSATGGDTSIGGTGNVGGGGSGGTDSTGGMETGGGGGIPNGGMSGGGAGGRGGRSTGGRSGAGMGGMPGGMGGAGVAGNAGCAGADLSSDPLNCGTCGHACANGIVCDNAVCVTSPCAGLTCAHAPIPMPTKAGEGYRADNIGTDDVCYEVLGYAAAVVAPKKPSIISWNFDPPRKLEVNAVTVPMTSDPGYWLSMPERGGGYCVHATAGDFNYAGIKLPIPGEYQ